MQSEWKKVKLSDVCEYVKDKIAVNILNETTYISTENMLPNKNGITFATSLPKVNLTQCFKKGDILISNIRPYFKKIWYAKFDAGCSNDVLVLRAKNGIDSNFLYYVLSDDNFFNYSMLTSKGTKMPRGDKQAIMDYEVPNISYETQKKIVSILKPIDDKIELNRAVNENLELQAQAIFKNWFIDNGDYLDKNKYVSLDNLIDVIDNRGKTPPLINSSTNYPIIDVRALSGNNRIINFNNCSKFVNYETYSNWFRKGHPKPWDILISTVGSIAEMKLFLGNKGCIAQNVVSFRSKNISSLYLYQYLNFIRKDLINYNIGSVQPSIKVSHIIKHLIFLPEKDLLNKFDNITKSLSLMMYNNTLENERLADLRDTLLPRLMSGELDVSALKYKI